MGTKLHYGEQVLLVLFFAIALGIAFLAGCSPTNSYAASPAPPVEQSIDKPAAEGDAVNVGEFLTCEVIGVYRHGGPGKPDSLVGTFHGEIHESVRKRMEPFEDCRTFRLLCAAPAHREKLKQFDGKKVAVHAILTVGDTNLDGKIIQPHLIVAAMKELKH